MRKEEQQYQISCVLKYFNYSLQIHTVFLGYGSAHLRRIKIISQIMTNFKNLVLKLFFDKDLKCMNYFR